MQYFDPHFNNWLLNKFETYKELRAMDKAYWSEKYGMYIITRYADVKYALGANDIFSSAKGNLIVEHPFRFSRTLGASDEPDHSIYKNIVKNSYSKDNIQRIADCFTSKATLLLNGKESLNISNVIEELSAWTTAEILNLPHDKEEIKNIVLGIQRNSPLAVSENIDPTCANQFKNIINDLAFVNKTAPTGPGIYKEFMEHEPEKLKLVSLFQGPTISGASSLTGALEFLTLDLFRENQLDTLIADRTLIPAAVEESLRFHASTGRFSRTVTTEVTLHGIDLKPGDRVALCLESANRDPAMFVEPEKFILNRNTVGQLAFGHGIHACIALAISKTMMIKYLEILLDLVGKYRVTTPHDELKYVMTSSGNDDMISNIHIEKDFT